MGFNQPGKLPIRFQSLPFETLFPALEKGTRSAFGALIQELSEGFLEDVGRVQTPVGQEQFLQRKTPEKNTRTPIV
ncbi:MAG: hypothetical protein KZQ89_19515 [Candidatus Thiodiazotropha sp. (ex Lucinoma kastoroae)]|nr:hypothetical protein [Candidatus Thiodiazotropha sp. (ex Lucinoma kastoroae)]